MYDLHINLHLNLVPHRAADKRVLEGLLFYVSRFFLIQIYIKVSYFFWFN